MHWEPRKNSTRTNVRASVVPYSKRRGKSTVRDGVADQQNLMGNSQRVHEEPKVNPVGTECWNAMETEENDRGDKYEKHGENKERNQGEGIAMCGKRGEVVPLVCTCKKVCIYLLFKFIFHRR